MKKFYSLILVLVLVFSIAQVTQAESRISQGEVFSISFDRTRSAYMMNVSTNNGDGWTIKLFQGPKNDGLINDLNRAFEGVNVAVYYDDMNTSDIYDDEIIDYYFTN